MRWVSTTWCGSRSIGAAVSAAALSMSGQRVRLVLEPRLAPPIVATRDRADDAVGAREERLERGDGDEPLAAREERPHVAVALGVDDDALAVLGVADALSGGERNGSAHYEILGWCRPT
jgi:hypothetical protein